MAKGSKLLKRENSKHELTSLRPLDWVEEKDGARAQHVTAPPPPPAFRRSRVRSTSDCKIFVSIFKNTADENSKCCPTHEHI